MEARGWIVFFDSHPVPALRYMQSPGPEPHVDRYLADLRAVAEGVRRGETTGEGVRATYT